MGWSVIENFRSGEKFPVVVHTIRAKRQAVAGPFWESKDNELCSLHQIATYQLRLCAIEENLTLSWKRLT